MKLKGKLVHVMITEGLQNSLRGQPLEKN
ncbi:hypothetical protein MYX76_17270 [Desulfobacterota bacterium AH_259_B03_O07]|nr:hypothetical protein [Desulfobacterota bacterium AH_259_B03_O07]